MRLEVLGDRKVASHYHQKTLCGIAGYSLAPGSSVERTVAARALLTGIAERGADAVGYAYRRSGSWDRRP